MTARTLRDQLLTLVIRDLELLAGPIEHEAGIPGILVHSQAGDIMVIVSEPQQPFPAPDPGRDCTPAEVADLDREESW
jgi:hypothetical protein